VAVRTLCRISAVSMPRGGVQQTQCMRPSARRPVAHTNYMYASMATSECQNAHGNGDRHASVSIFAHCAGLIRTFSPPARRLRVLQARRERPRRRLRAAPRRTCRLPRTGLWRPLEPPRTRHGTRRTRQSSRPKPPQLRRVRRCTLQHTHSTRRSAHHQRMWQH